MRWRRRGSVRRAGSVVLVALGMAAWLGGHSCLAEEDGADSPPPIKIKYANGFKLESGDGAFSLRLYAALQARFTITDFDQRVAGNDEDVANFFLRRARLWWDGHAFSPKFTYYFHLQLEPTAAVNLHDAWVQYAFSDAFKLGVGRNKIPYGAEFLASGFALNFIDRSVMYGETDIPSGSASTWPGGGTAPLVLAGEHPYTGFPTGGLSLFRSQGVLLSGTRGLGGDVRATWEVGLWNGRNSRGMSNADTRLLTSARVTLFPLGSFDTTVQGDPEGIAAPRVAVMLSAYQDGSRHTRDATGQDVGAYEARDRGTNVAALGRLRGASLDVEWGSERYRMRRAEPGPWEFERGGWRVAAGYVVWPRRLEVVARSARLERLRRPTREAALSSGVGLVRIEDGGTYVSAVERSVREATVGLNLYFGDGHQHKVFVDLSSLRRTFVDEGQGEPAAQRDRRARLMLQLRF